MIVRIERRDEPHQIILVSFCAEEQYSLRSYQSVDINRGAPIWWAPIFEQSLIFDVECRISVVSSYYYYRLKTSDAWRDKETWKSSVLTNCCGYNYDLT